MSTEAAPSPGEILAIAPGADRPPRSSPTHSSLVVDSVATAALGATIFVIGLGGDLRRLGGPLGSGDLLQAYATAKPWSDGTPFGNNSLGYPFGMEQRYFPTADVLQNALAGLISAISQNPFVGLNVVYALSFPLAALAALWVFRLVGVRGPIAVFSPSTATLGGWPFRSLPPTPHIIWSRIRFATPGNWRGAGGSRSQWERCSSPSP